MAKIRLYFNKDDDVLEISIGTPKKAISEELGDDIIAHKDQKTKKIVGFTILNFMKRFKTAKKPREIDLPLKFSAGPIVVR